MTKNSAIEKLRYVAAQTIPQGGQAILYGSQARGDVHHGSDWDILILLDKKGWSGKIMTM